MPCRECTYARQYQHDATEARGLRAWRVRRMRRRMSLRSVDLNRKQDVRMSMAKRAAWDVCGARSDGRNWMMQVLVESRYELGGRGDEQWNLDKQWELGEFRTES